MLQEEHSCSHGQQASLCYQATPPYCVTLYNSQSKQECWNTSVRMCVQVRVREKRERETDADKTLESLIIYIL